MKSQDSTSTAEDIRQETVKLLKKEARRTGEAKIDWGSYEAIMREALPFPVNRGFLFGLLLAKKFGKIKITLELIEEEKPSSTASKRRKR